ncbi:MAG: anti-phage defense ZorAB system ZorA [Magnetococcales bacterium]|nr:anti-phage defense ZorAB system ZorA [Magnetococcales bacterium]
MVTSFENWFGVILRLQGLVIALWNETFPEFWHLWAVVFILLCIVIVFVFYFTVPAFLLKGKLSFATKKLSSIRDGLNGRVVELSEIAQVMGTPSLVHAWKEYTETLHPQREVDDTGQSRVVQWRATSLSEIFFSEHAIVGIPLKTDFYKHLPGILTGIGIIGTFIGLIHGLSSFDVSDPTRAQTELRNLINAVGHAFYVSAAAIAMAMLFTWIEKSMVTARNRQVAALRQIIDSLFDAGAGEEYLERLVRASETQATQALHIKDALVADLHEILKTLTDRQLEEQSRRSAEILQAQAEHSGRLSQDVGRAIAEHLGGPISDIAGAVKGVSANQGDAVNKMLMDVLAGFSAQVQDMLGGQMRGMTDLLRETSEAMRQSADKFAGLAADMDSAGKGAVEAMGERLNDALTSMEARQGIMNRQMEDFVARIGELVAESQTTSARKLQETLGQLGEQVVGVVAELRRQAEGSAETQGRRQERFEESTGRAVQMLSAQMEGLLAQSVETSRSLRDAVTNLSKATGETIASMNQGVERLQVAASDFAKAGGGVAETMRAAGEVTASIKAASGTLSTATLAARDVFADHARTSDSFAAMVTELKSITENARRDAAMTSTIIAGFEAAAGKLGDARRQSEDYLEGVTEVLAKTHESFAEHVGKTLRDGNRDFQKELRSAVEMVSAAVRDLGDTLEDAPGRRR